jgi:hypothetical protein
MTSKAFVKRLEKIEQEVRARKQRVASDVRVREATSDTYAWATRHTQTYNEHWVEEKRPSPYEPFPPLPHFQPMFEILDLEPIVWIEKSRDLMVSWACVAYLTLHAMRTPQRGVLFQTLKYNKAIDLVEYAKCLYRGQPAWLKAAFPLAKPLESQPKDVLEFAHGGYVLGVPGGANQMRGLQWLMERDITPYMRKESRGKFGSLRCRSFHTPEES